MYVYSIRSDALGAITINTQYIISNDVHPYRWHSTFPAKRNCYSLYTVVESDKSLSCMYPRAFSAELLEILANLSDASTEHLKVRSEKTKDDAERNRDTQTIS